MDLFHFLFLAVLQFDISGIDPGGIIGISLFNSLKVYIGRAGAFIGAISAGWIAGVMVLHLSFFETSKYVFAFIRNVCLYIVQAFKFLASWSFVIFSKIVSRFRFYRSKDTKEDSNNFILEDISIDRQPEEELEEFGDNNKSVELLSKTPVYNNVHSDKSVLGAFFRSMRNSVCSRNFFEVCKKQGILLLVLITIIPVQLRDQLKN